MIDILIQQEPRIKEFIKSNEIDFFIFNKFKAKDYILNFYSVFNNLPLWKRLWMEFRKDAELAFIKKLFNFIILNDYYKGCFNIEFCDNKESLVIIPTDDLIKINNIVFSKEFFISLENLNKDQDEFFLSVKRMQDLLIIKEIK